MQIQNRKDFFVEKTACDKCCKKTFLITKKKNHVSSLKFFYWKKNQCTLLHKIVKANSRQSVNHRKLVTI